jgi:predicted nucleic acid-binding Zn ribbon protein
VKRLGDEVSRELGRFGAAEGMTRIVEAWPAAVGPTIARNAWPARIARDGTLHVATSSSSWAFELAQLEADVVRRLRAAAGAKSPERIRFAVGKLPELGPEDVGTAGATAPRPRPEDVERAAELTAEIEDEELREVVAKAAAQSLFRAGDDRSF